MKRRIYLLLISIGLLGAAHAQVPLFFNVDTGNIAITDPSNDQVLYTTTFTNDASGPISVAGTGYWTVYQNSGPIQSFTANVGIEIDGVVIAQAPIADQGVNNSGSVLEVVGQGVTINPDGSLENVSVGTHTLSVVLIGSGQNASSVIFQMVISLIKYGENSAELQAVQAALQASLQSNNTALTTQLTALGTRLAQDESTITELQSQPGFDPGTINTEIASLQSQFSTLQSQVGSKQSQVSPLMEYGLPVGAAFGGVGASFLLDHLIDPPKYDSSSSSAYSPPAPVPGARPGYYDR